MIKKPYWVVAISITLILLFSVVFANITADKAADDGTAGNLDNAVVALEIDYGRTVTQNNQVTLNLNVTGKNIDLNNLKAQFSLDNKNWSGYNSSTQKWVNGFLGEYQSFYPNFHIGSNSGLKTVYAKVVDKNGNIGSASAKINFSPHSEDPDITSPQPVELSKLQETLAKAGIKSGSGALYDPYVVSSNKTGLISEIPNAAEVCYHTGGGIWSSWHKIEDGQADIPIVFDWVEGLKEVQVRSRNKYGIEGNPETIYYLLDYTKPTVNLYTSYHSFTAINGKLQFDLEVDDNLSETLNFEVKVCDGGDNIIKRGRVKKYDKDKSTVTSVTVEGLPEGKFDVKVNVVDGAGNKNTEQISVNSIKT